MSDTQPAAEAALKNPAESVQVEDSAHVKPDMKAEASAEDPTASATDDAKSGDKEAANGESKVDKTEESSPVRKEKPKGDKENGGHYKSHSGKYDRGNKHGGYKFDKDKKPRSIVFCFFAAHSLTDFTRHNEFENLPETDDPVEIRAQV
jgi:lupus La protein